MVRCMTWDYNISPTINHETLSKRWSISRECAKATVQQKTQRGVWMCLHPSLTKKYPTNDRMLQYN